MSNDEFDIRHCVLLVKNISSALEDIRRPVSGNALFTLQCRLTTLELLFRQSEMKAALCYLIKESEISSKKLLSVARAKKDKKYIRECWVKLIVYIRNHWEGVKRSIK
jgi:hypothetical protein